MAVNAGFLIDTSAAARMRLAAVADRLEPLITGGLVATCGGLDAEALYSTRSAVEYEQVRADRREAYEYPLTDYCHWQRAFDAQVLNADLRHPGRQIYLHDTCTALAQKLGIERVRQRRVERHRVP